jgi:hypothetical protein
MSNRILVDGSKAAGKAALEFIDALNEALAKGRRLRGQLDAMAWGSPADYAQVAAELGLPAPSVNYAGAGRLDHPRERDRGDRLPRGGRAEAPRPGLAPMEQTVPLWAFVALAALFNILLSAVIYRLWAAVDHNTEQLTLLRVSLPERYVTRAEFIALDVYAHKSAHDLWNEVRTNDTEIAEMRVMLEAKHD